MDERKDSEKSLTPSRSANVSRSEATVSTTANESGLDSVAHTTISKDGTIYTTVSSSPFKASELRKNKLSGNLTKFSASSSTMPSLDFDSIPLVGREKEISQLKTCFHTLQEGRKEIVFIDGQSGSGKSTLVLSLEAEMQRQGDDTSGMFVHGKFDMNSSSEPYSGISKAFDELCRTVQHLPADSVLTVQDRLKEQLGDEIEMLVNLIPELKELLATNETKEDSPITNLGSDEIESKLEKLRFGFRVLMRVFCSVCSRMVLFLDDLQWADVSSLQVLEFLMTDAQNERPLMIVGCYRSGEVDENSLLHIKMMALKEMTDTHKFNMSRITVGHFGIEDIEQVISSLFPTCSKDEKFGLASLCLKRTLGSPFFVVEFLKMLHQEGFFHNDGPSETVVWDLEKIDYAAMSTANVVIILHNRLLKLPPQVQSLLQCVSYLGSTFSESIIDVVWSTYGRRLMEAKIEPTNALLTAIVKEEILEMCGENQYRWIHDKLQEAALSLTGNLRESFQLDIGRTLYYSLDESQVEQELFTIVDLINNGNVLKLSEFTKANLRAAEKARSLSAFQAAAQYAAQGINLLKEDKWTSNRSTTLQLYTVGAEMEAMSGNIDTAKSYCDEVLSQPDLTVMETLPLKMTIARFIGSSNLKFDESMTYYLDLLRELGCRVTWARRLVPVQAKIKLMKTMKRIRKTPQSFFDTMVAIEDSRQKAIASVYAKLVYTAFAAGDMMLFVLCSCQLVDLTLAHGINEFSAKSIASVAESIAVAMEDYDTATEINMIALSMIQRFRGMHNSETIFLAYIPALGWVKSFEEVITPIGDAVAEGLKCGDTEYAIWNLVISRIILPFVIGRPITSLLQDCPKTFIQCEDAGQMLNAMCVKVMWQMMSNIQDCGSINKATELEGDVFSRAKDEEMIHIHLGFVLFAEGELALFCGDYEAAADRALRVGDELAKLIPAFLIIPVEVFHRAVALYAAARSTRKRKYRLEARRLLKKVGKWAKCGYPNVQYYYLHLMAEQLALDKEYEKADQKYEEALKVVSTSGHCHHIGLLNERYADFLLEECSMKEKSIGPLRRAIEGYRKWGAGWKAESLEGRL